jgi:hypothetical protein
LNGCRYYFEEVELFGHFNKGIIFFLKIFQVAQETLDRYIYILKVIELIMSHRLHNLDFLEIGAVLKQFF